MRDLYRVTTRAGDPAYIAFLFTVMSKEIDSVTMRPWPDSEGNPFTISIDDFKNNYECIGTVN